METFGILLAFLFVVLPLPLCLYLLSQRSKDEKRILILEHKLSDLDRGPLPSPHAQPTEAEAQKAAPDAGDAANLKTPSPPPSILFTDAPSGTEREETRPSIPRTAPRKAPPSSTPTFIPFLQSIGLWPPAHSLHAEAGLMQWWLPRIGGLLATLALISGAVYIGQNSTPWVRFMELVVADVAVLATAALSFKRNPKFGQVLLATGLSMLYLTSVAAYAAPPVRIIGSPVLGIAIQFLVIAAIFAISLLRRDRTIGILALVYGYLSCLYSSYLDLSETALISALSLYLAGIAINRSFNSKAILSISVIGVYAPALSLILLREIDSTTFALPSENSLIGFLFIYVSILPMREIFAPQFKSDAATFSKLHALNTSLFLGLGYLCLKLFTDQFALFYGLAALLLFGFAIAFRKRGLDSFLFQLFFLKATALSALWCINHFEGDVRWFALALEALLVAWVATRSKSRYQEIACFALWTVSTFLAHQAKATDGSEAFTFTWYLFLAQPILAGLLFSFLHGSLKRSKTRTAFYCLAAGINAINAFVFIGDTFADASHAPAYLSLYAVVFAVLAFAPLLSLVPAAVTSSLIALIANLLFWTRPDSLLSLLAVLIVAGGAAYASASYANALKRKAFALAEFLFHITWFVSLYAFTFEHFHYQVWFAFFPAIASLILLTVPAAGSNTIRDLSLLPLLLYILFPQAEPLGALVIHSVIIVYLLPLCITYFFPQKEKDFGLFDKKEAWRVALHLLVYVILIRLLFSIESWLSLMLTSLSIALAFYWLWFLHKRTIALVLSLTSAAGAGLLLVRAHQHLPIAPHLPQAWGAELLTGGLALATTALFLSLAPSRLKGFALPDAGKTVLAYAGALTAYASLALALSYDELSLMTHFTPLLAFFCLILVGIGIGLKSKPYRVIAVAGLLLPLGRLFVHDIRDTLTRIIAFAALGILLTFIGYLYHRFQSRID